MQDFKLYFDLGRQHIADLAGYDHILFVTALCLRYTVQDWKKILILVTAFTIGHSITLALSVLNYVNISTRWIEFLIPVTILITAISNVFQKNTEQRTRVSMIYLLALFFGMIHGLGFSNYLKGLLGKQTNIVSELLAFNIGLEVGQLLIVGAVLLVSVICVQLLKIQRRDYLLFVSGAVFGIALLMTIERFPN
ncbi:MAG: HupE/UreJ family protein [Chitinophagaceae bacterium]|nr:HupE/UreJ family protein [Chitinophagaceae bacterium]